jgi:hypothetical protein
MPQNEFRVNRYQPLSTVIFMENAGVVVLQHQQ